MGQKLKKKLSLTLIFCCFFGFVYSQYNIPMAAFGNGGGKVSGNEYSALFVAGQNVIGKMSGDNYTAYMGILAPVNYLRTDVSVSDLTKTFQLQNYPNPFKEKTTISFNISGESDVKLSVLNILGQEVTVLLNRKMPAGQHSVEFIPADKKNGIYFYQLRAGDSKSVRKMIMMD